MFIWCSCLYFDSVFLAVLEIYALRRPIVVCDVSMSAEDCLIPPRCLSPHLLQCLHPLKSLLHFSIFFGRRYPLRPKRHQSQLTTIILRMTGLMTIAYLSAFSWSRSRCVTNCTDVKNFDEIELCSIAYIRLSYNCYSKKAISVAYKFSIWYACWW